MTYGFLLSFAFVRTIFDPNWFVYVEVYFLQLFTIIAFDLNAHIMLFRYVICNYIWHMGSQNYELKLSILHHSQFKRWCIIDPWGPPTVTAGSDHYFRRCRLSVRPSVSTFHNIAKQNNFQVKIVIATGGTVGMAEWIIDGTHMSCCILNSG